MYLRRGGSVAHLSSDDVEELGGDALLAQFIVFELELFEQLVGIVIGTLHGHDTSGLLTGAFLGDSLLHHRKEIHGQDSAENGGGVGLEEVGAVLTDVSPRIVGQRLRRDGQIVVADGHLLARGKGKRLLPATAIASIENRTRMNKATNITFLFMLHSYLFRGHKAFAVNINILTHGFSRFIQCLVNDSAFQKIRFFHNFRKQIFLVKLIDSI